MKKIKNSNNGFTLIELVIAIAILAFVMAAVSSFMGVSVYNNRKAQADVVIQTTAQETYDSISDSFKQAKDIVIIGYPMTDADNDDPTYYFYVSPGVVETKMVTQPGSSTQVKQNNLKDKYYEAINNHNASAVETPDQTSVKTFDKVATEKIVVKQIYVSYAAKIDGAVPSTFVDGTYTDFFGNTVALNAEILSSGKKVYSSDDTVTVIYTFDTKKVGNADKTYLYLEKIYSKQDSKTTTGMLDSSTLYANSLYGKISSEKAPCVVNVNATAGQISLTMEFEDKGMTYSLDGLTNVRNSYVLKPKNTATSEAVSSNPEPEENPAPESGEGGEPGEGGEAGGESPEETE